MGQVRGFITLLVIGVLAVLVMMTISIAAHASATDKLVENHMNRVVCRQLARSGYEKAVSIVFTTGLHDQRKPFHADWDLLGLRTGRVAISGSDLSGRLNVNDGIRAGLMEMGPDRYKSNEVNPWRPDSDFDWDEMEELADARNSGMINIRIRRLLNAYGEAVRFEMEGAPDLFELMTSDSAVASLSSGELYRPDPRGLGDEILVNRPGHGYKQLSDLAAIVNQWAETHGLEVPVGRRDFFDVVSADLTVQSWEDDTVFRFTKPLGSYSYQPLTAHPNLRSRLFTASMSSHGIVINDDDTAPHSVATVNLNQASEWVRTAVFYALTNVEFPAMSSSSVSHDNVGPDVEAVPSYAKSLTAEYSLGGTVFDPDRVTENGEPWTLGPSFVQPSRLMSFRDAIRLARYWDIDHEETGESVVDFDSFRDMLDRHYLEWLPSIGEELERAEPLPASFNDEFNGGEFLQDYLSRILPHVLSGSRRLPRWTGAPSALLSPLYKPVKPHPVISKSRGIRTVEDFCRRQNQPKVDFLPSGLYRIESHAVLHSPHDSRCSIEVDLEAFDKIIWRSQKDFLTLTIDDDNQTHPAVRIGPEFTIRDGGGTDPDHFMGFLGLQKFADESAYSSPPDISLGMGVDGINSRFSQGMPATNPNDDPWIGEPLEALTSTGLTRAQIALRPADFEGTLDPEGRGVSTFRHRDFSELSPFGGIHMSSRFNGPTRNGASLKDIVYWNLMEPSAGGEEPLVNSGQGAGANMARGLVNLWFQIPSSYPYAQENHGGGGGFQTLFSVVVWDITQPHVGVYSFETVGTYQAIMRPVEIKVGIVWDIENMSYALVGRCEQPNAGQETLVTRVNTALHPRPDLENGLFHDSESDQGDLPRPYFPDRDGLGDTMPIMAIPGMMRSPATWCADQARVLQRKIIFPEDNPDFGPGTWHRVSVGWNLNSNFNPEDTFWMLMMEEVPTVDGPRYTQFDDYGTYDETDVDRYRPRNLMMTYGTQNVFTVGGCLARVAVRDPEELDPSSSGWEGRWLLNSSVADVQAFFGDIPFGYQHATDSAYTDVQPASFYARGDLYHWSASFKNIFPNGQSDRHLMAVGARIYQPTINPDPVQNARYVPPVNLAMIDGDDNEILPVMVSRSGSTHIHDGMSDTTKTVFRITWDLYNNVPDDKNINEVPIVQDVWARLGYPNGPRVLSWSVH